MSRVKIGDREISLSPEVVEQITRGEAKKAASFSNGLQQALENIVTVLDKPTDERHGQELQRAFERMSAQFEYVDSGVRAIAALHFVKVPES